MGDINQLLGMYPFLNQNDHNQLAQYDGSIAAQLRHAGISQQAYAAQQNAIPPEPDHLNPNLLLLED
jgi:hypothetical protein